MSQADMDATLSVLNVSTNLKEGIKEADCAIESVFERADLKRTVFEQLVEACPKQTILSSNTSGIPISLLASAARRPDKIIGMDFAIPVPLTKGTEVVRSLLTSEETLKASLDFATSIDIGHGEATLGFSAVLKESTTGIFCRGYIDAQVKCFSHRHSFPPGLGWPWAPVPQQPRLVITTSHQSGCTTSCATHEASLSGRISCG